MSILKLKGNASGTGTVTLEAPNTNTDQTIAIPDGAGSFVTANASGDVAVTGDLTVDTNTLYVDSANNRVGVGTSSPSRQLSIIDSTNPFLQLALSTDAAANNGLEIVMDASGAYFQNRENTPTIFSTNNTERMRIASDGSVGIGTSSPSNYYANHLVVDVGSSAQSGVSIVADTSNEGMLAFADGTSGDARYRGFVNYSHAGDFMNIGTAGTERIRIASNGSKNFGTHTSDTFGYNLFVGAATNNAFACRFDGVGTGASNVLQFVNGYGQVGSVTLSGASTAFNTSSDYRLKTDIQPITGASARVQALNPVNFAWIASGERVDGFIAHEAQEVVPEAVSGEKDAMREEQYEVTPAVLDEDGNVVTEAVMGTREVIAPQGIDQSKLVPLLTAALQEALAKIETLETEMTSVKARLDALEAV